MPKQKKEFVLVEICKRKREKNNFKKIVKYKLRCYSIIRVIYCEFFLNNIFYIDV